MTEQKVKHTKTDPVCIHYKETGLFRRFLNERGRGKACLVCVPLFKESPLTAHHERVQAMAKDAAGYVSAWPTES